MTKQDTLERALPRCASGKHVWTDPADAAKCCSPDWQRALDVGTTDTGAWFRHYWRRIEPKCNNRRQREARA
jgi:hypothetical protein